MNYKIQLWTGVISLEGLEYYALTPLVVIVLVGLPLFLLSYIFTNLFAVLSAVFFSSSAPAVKI